jgi:hypothetical protein
MHLKPMEIHNEKVIICFKLISIYTRDFDLNKPE